MLWVGIGLSIIGVALLIISIVLIKPLLKLSGVFGSLQKTTDELPTTVNTLTSQTTEAIGTGVETLNQVNVQIKELSPVFRIVGDIGRATNKLSSSVVHQVEERDETQPNGKLAAKDFKGFYGLIALVYLLFKSKK
ncbi:DUF948 domain-containing protein [Oceanobacillus piezotolerans]|uniref:DUF948 domain-containing protein n=1 Tax=Oceanobacillus piezotolerans TaxID=2448030 RepID=A0A498D5W1_9BACI|nr:DUF948 domain-containing protein [Oceanobacillus piezotolerans]RLL39949.1 DUF948 domain-containing protein [Oceanobacillus piezotolerans]